MKQSNQRFLLASGSPRRKELLEKMGLEFEILVTDANEDVEEGWNPSQAVATLSKRKAEEAVKTCMEKGCNGLVVIAADTIVYKDGKILGKPKDKQDAFAILNKLGNDWHDVYTGLTVAFIHTALSGDKGKCMESVGGTVEYVQDVCRTRVRFKTLTRERIEAYVNTGEPFDKAGAYAIQGKGGDLVERIEGDYDNVVGLSTERLRKILRQNLCL